EVVMIVETDFANRPCGPRRRKLIADYRRRARRIVGELMGLVRVDADGEARLRPQLLEPRRLLGLRGVAALENHERPFQAGVTRARHHLIEIGGKHRVGKVAVAVDHRHVRPARCAAIACCCSNAASASSSSSRSFFFVTVSANAYSIEFRTMRLSVM